MHHLSLIKTTEVNVIFSSSVFAAFTSDEAETKGADAVFAGAKGVLVCPKITKMGIGIGYEGGECVLTEGSRVALY